MKKKILTYAASTAMLSSLIWAGSALAINNVAVTVNSQDIQAKATCDKAGDFSFTFDAGSELRGGDQIQMDLDYIDGTTLSTLCRTIDVMIAPMGDGNKTVDLGGGPISTGWGMGGAGTVVPPLAASPVTATVPALAGVDTDGGVIFYVHGIAGSQRLIMDVISADLNNNGNVTESSLTIANVVDSELTVKFLDQRTNSADFTSQFGIWADNDGDGIYDDNATLDQNTMCINISLWNLATVDAHIKSAATKYSFNNPDPEVAHVVPAASYSTTTCLKQNCGDLVIGSAIQGGTTTCAVITNETPGPGTAYCQTGNVHANNQLYFTKVGGTFDAANYQVVMNVKVNGVQSPTQGVYFTNAPIITNAYDTTANACSMVGGAMTSNTATYATVGGTATAAQAAGAPNCVVTAKAVTATTVASGLGITAATHGVLHVAIPELQYVLTEIADGDQVTVDVTLLKAPCGELITSTLCLGTFKSACNVVGAGNSLVFPYFTAALSSADSYWDGIAVSNMSTSAGNVTFTLYEQDGDISTATVAIGANSMIINTLEGIAFTLTTNVEGTIGNSPGYVTAMGDTVTIDGFAMMGDNGTGQSMGYLPRM